jgi:hypothetical protein
MTTLEKRKISEAINSDRKVFVKWTEVRAGSRRTFLEKVTTTGHLVELIEAASNDIHRETVGRFREERTGMPWNENWTRAPEGAEETLGDNIQALNGGDDDVSVFEVPEFAELLEQFHAGKFNANTFPTAAQVTDILCELR